MRILSEKTHKEYESVEECLAAEKEFDEAQAKVKAELEQKSKIKKQKAEEIEQAYKKLIDANDNFVKLKNAFIDEYGYFHMTYRNKSAIPTVNDIFDILCNLW